MDDFMGKINGKKAECDGECFKHIFIMFKSRVRRAKINYYKINSRWIQFKVRDKSLKTAGGK